MKGRLTAKRSSIVDLALPSNQPTCVPDGPQADLLQRAKQVVANCNFSLVITSFIAPLMLTSCGLLPDTSTNNDEAAFTSVVEQAVKANLRDPNSAIIDDVFVLTEAKMASGNVNARNGFGGYTGKQRFVYVDGQVALDTEVNRYTKLDKTFIAALKQNAIKVSRHTVEILEGLPDSPEKDRSVAKAKADLVKSIADAR